MLRQSPEGRTLFSQLLHLMNRYCRGVIVEGVETPEEWRDVQNSPAFAEQGWFLSRPAPIETLNTAVLALAGCLISAPAGPFLDWHRKNMRKRTMSKAGKITAAISGGLLLLIVVAIILIANFDWNRLKPTINQKVSAELNRPFAIRGDLGVVWERQKQETGWRSWVPWPHVHAEDIILGNPPDIPEVTMVHLPRVEATLAPLALLTKTVWLPWIKLEKPDARLIRL